MKYNAIQTSELCIIDGFKFELKRTFFIPKKYRYPDLGKSVEKNIYPKIAEDGTFLIAVRVLNIKEKKAFKTQKIVQTPEINWSSPWYLEETVDKLKLGTISYRIDPFILILSDTKNLKYRLNYYLSLINEGATPEEALSTIFS